MAMTKKREDELALNKLRRINGGFDILQLKNLGLEVEQLNSFHFRVCGVLDFYPTNRRFHNLKTNQRGFYYDNPLSVVEAHFGKVRLSLFQKIKNFIVGETTKS